MVRLGAGGLDGRALTAEAMTRRCRRFRNSTPCRFPCRGRDSRGATSAVREARNGGEFLARIEEKTGIRRGSSPARRKRV